jgi:hypothetical protein
MLPLSVCLVMAVLYLRRVSVHALLLNTVLLTSSYILQRASGSMAYTRLFVDYIKCSFEYLKLQYRTQKTV